MSRFSFSSGSIELGARTYIMGIVNVTPDSFSDGGKYFSSENAVDHSLKLIEEGADIIDLGACSTKPFSEKVSAETETERLLPVLRQLRKETDIPVSIDTFYAETAEIMLSEGADIINDTGGVFNSDTVKAVKRSKAGYIVMHGGVRLAPSETVFTYPEGIIKNVNAFFKSMAEKLENAGLDSEHISFDPGFGFIKDTEQNRDLLNGLKALDKCNSALTVGLSRKRFIGQLSDDEDVGDRLGGTLAANMLAVIGGADIIRTHEVKIHRKALTLIDNTAR